MEFTENNGEIHDDQEEDDQTERIGSGENPASVGNTKAPKSSKQSIPECLSKLQQALPWTLDDVTVESFVDEKGRISDSIKTQNNLK